MWYTRKILRSRGDFTSHHMEQVAIDLKINLMFSKVGVPRGRGKIERFFRQLTKLS